MPKVYSYLRFSSAKQAAGASAARQMDYARKWADQNGLVLDESLNLRDEGLSAYHQTHVRKGALGAFLLAANEGRIDPGSTLVVEGLDRLSRTDPIDAQAQLTSIINAGISVVTACDGKVYSRESLKANPMDLIYSILVMVRANEESETKSSRVGDALRRKCEGWVNGTYRGKISCGNVPSWVTWNGERYEAIPEMVESIRYAITRFIDGLGAVRILQELTEKGASITGANFAENVLQLIKQVDAFKGDRALTVGGTTYKLVGYYPRIIDDEEAARLELAIESRKRNKRIAGGKSDKPGLFTGMNIGFCGYCGSGITTQNLTRKKEDRYKEERVYRRLRCVRCTGEFSKQKAPNSRGKLPVRFCIADPIEKAILDFCSDQFNLDSLFAGSDKTTEANRRYTLAAGRVLELEKQQAKLVDAAMSEDGDLPAVLLAKLRDIESELVTANKDVDLAQAQIKALASTPDSAEAARWKDLREKVLAMDYDSRQAARQLMQDAFSRVELFFDDKDPITQHAAVRIVLTAKTQETRAIWIDRSTGEWTTKKRMIPADGGTINAAILRVKSH